ncbi:MAG: hypothetical protein JO048_02845 [Methylobacteriaceae bacterium]|nr:hypothetical protein [Methylobacteriaceae bacterium]
MRSSFAALSLAALVGVTFVAEASAEPLRLNVRPRSFLDAGRVVAPGSSINPASAQGQMISYYLSPPYIQQRDFYGEGTLPSPLGGPFVGATNLLGPVDLFGELDR